MARGGTAGLLGRTAAAGAGFVGLVVAWAAFAQGRDSGRDAAPPRLVFDLSSTLRADSNRSLDAADPDPGARLDTRLGFTLDTRTRTDRLLVSGSALLRLSSGEETASDTGSGLQEPRLRLAYDRDTGNAKLSLSASYALSDVNLTDTLFLPDGSPGERVARDGTVADSALTFSLHTGVNDPLGFILSASASRRDYEETSDPDVSDSRRRALDLTARLTLSPDTRIDLNLGYRHSEDDNATLTRRTDRSVSLRLGRALSPVASLQAEIGYSRNRRDQVVLGLPVTETADGAFGLVGLSLARPNGTASVTLSSQRDIEGLRNSLRFGRSLELARGGELAADIGISARPGGDPQLVGSLRYAEPLPSGRIEARLERSVSLDADGEDVTATRLALAWNHELTAVSRLGLSADYSRSSADADTVTRRSLRASWSRELTPDWSLEAGIQYRDREDDAGTARSSAVFVTIGRRFVGWP